MPLRCFAIEGTHPKRTGKHLGQHNLKMHSKSTLQAHSTHLNINWIWQDTRQATFPIPRIHWNRGWLAKLDPSGCSTIHRHPRTKHTMRQRQSLLQSRFPVYTKSYPSFPRKLLKISLPAVWDDLRIETRSDIVFTIHIQTISYDRIQATSV